MVRGPQADEARAGDRHHRHDALLADDTLDDLELGLLDINDGEHPAGPPVVWQPCRQQVFTIRGDYQARRAADVA